MLYNVRRGLFLLSVLQLIVKLMYIVTIASTFSLSTETNVVLILIV